MATKKPDYDGIYKSVHEFYMEQVLLIKEFYEYQFDNFKNIDNERINSLYPLLLSIYLTGNAINLLSLNNFLSESYILSRSMLEKIINYLYILCCYESEYKKYLNYTKQKGYRILNRSFTAGTKKAELNWSAFIELDSYPELKEAVDQFTSKKGKIITRWSSLSIADRLALIEERGLIKIDSLVLSTLGIYDDASEALHGTLYGSTFHYGFFEGNIPSNVKEFTEIYRNRMLFLFYALAVNIHSVFSLVPHLCTNDKFKYLAKKSSANLETCQKLISKYK